MNEEKVTAVAAVKQITDVAQSVLELARDKEIDAEKLRVIYDLAESARREQARIAFIRAFQQMRSELPPLSRDGAAMISGQVRYRYPRLSTAMATIWPVAAKYGFTISWRYGFQDDLIIVTCVLQHLEGHREECSLAAQADTTGSKSRVQAVGSTVSYLERYTFLGVFGLVAVDDEERAVMADLTIESERKRLLTQLALAAKAADVDQSKIVAYLGVERWDDITTEQARTLLPRLQKRARKLREKA